MSTTEALPELLRTFERNANRFGELWERCQGKGWPEAESREFHEIRDERLPAMREKLRAALAAAAPMLNGLTASETAETASVAGLTEPPQVEIDRARAEVAAWPAEIRAAAHVTGVLSGDVAARTAQGEVPAELSAERYCLWCRKDGHLSTECHSTHGLNTPAAHELLRLCRLETELAQARAAVPGAAEANWTRDGIATFIADNWPDRKHTLAEIEAGIRAIKIRPLAAAPNPPAAAPAFDADAAKRLRAICGLLGLATSVPPDDATLMGAQFAVFGMLRRAIEIRSGLATSSSADARDGAPVVKVTAQGVQFGDAWFSHERITGYTADQLNAGNCHVTGRAYMKWVDAAIATTKQEPRS